MEDMAVEVQEDTQVEGTAVEATTGIQAVDTAVRVQEATQMEDMVDHQAREVIAVEDLVDTQVEVMVVEDMEGTALLEDTPVEASGDTAVAADMEVT